MDNSSDHPKVIHRTIVAIPSFFKMLRNTFPRLWILWITHAILWITYRLSTISTCVGSRPGPTSASTTRGWIPPFLEISLVALTISSCADASFQGNQPSAFVQQRQRPSG